MINFEQAFQRGLSSAKIAEANKTQILDIINRLSSQIAAATAGKVRSIKMVKGAEEVDIGNSFLTLLPPYARRTQIREYTALIAEGGTSKSPTSEELCEITIDPNGYPILLKFDDQEFTCHDVESLELALARLLEFPLTGAKFQKLINANAA